MEGFIIYLFIAFGWFLIFGGIFATHIVHSKREGRRWNRGYLVSLIFFGLLWIVPLIFGFAIALAFSTGLTSM